jgi:hypothetical protein
MELETTHWQVPKFESSPTARIGWVEEQIQEGEGFLEGQACYRNLGTNLRVFDAIFRDKSRSTLITNELKYDIRKFCETLAEVREIAAYGSDVPAYKQYAEMLTKVARAVYLESDFPSQVLKWLQYASVMGIGYLWPKVRADEYGYGERKMVFDALGLLDVVPIQIPRSNDVQDAYAVTIYDYMPIAEAHGRFSLFQGQLQTVGPRSYKTQVQAKRLDYAERFRYGEQGRSFGNLYSEIRYTFIRDLRINNTGFELPMGDPGTTWFYKVPYLGQQIFGGMRNGQPYMRSAMVEDCRVYPTLRLIITSPGVDRPMYDGPCFDWDSKFPVIQLTVDDWAWEALGRSLVGDVATIETTTRKIERKIDDVITITLNPPIGYDHTATGGAKIEHFDIFEQDVRYGVDGKPKEILQSILPEEVRVNNEHFTFLKYLKDCKQSQLGLLDMGNLQNIKMNIANDTADKMLEGIGPLAKGIAARIEKANKAVGRRMMFLIMQWFNASRLMEYVGPENMAREMFDFDPSNLVPSHLPDEMVNGELPVTPSQYDQLTRARWFVRQIRLISVPSTLLRITQMQEQLKYLQLKRGNAPISWATVMKKLGVENYGDVKGNTERERWFNEELETQKLQILAAAQAQQLMKQLGIQPPEQGAGGGKPQGRPTTGNKAPKIKQKGGAGGAPRTTVTES